MEPKPKKKTQKKPATKTRTASPWYPLATVPEGFLSLHPRTAGAVHSSDEALTLSPVFAALRLYQSTIASLPLVTYRKLPDGGRERATTHPAYALLHERPNPAQSRSTFFEYVVRELFLSGEAFIHVRRLGTGEPLGLYPIASSTVEQVVVDAEWNKAYFVRTDDGAEVYQDKDIIHLFRYSNDGIRGVPLVRYAAESLGLHRQVLESAGAYYVNAAKPSGYLKYPGKLDKQAIENLSTEFKDSYAGTKNTGKVPLLQNGGDWSTFANTNATDAQIIEALGSSVTDVARWFGVSPLLLGDLSRGTYSNLAADNAAFYQRSVRPILDKVELEINAKLFGIEGGTYAEFLVDAILRGDPLQQQSIFNGYVQAGIVTRAEVRDWLNLPPIAGLDTPLYPLNQGPELADQGGDQEQADIVIPTQQESNAPAPENQTAA